MLAERIMVTELITARVDEHVGDVLARMRQEKIRMLPVLDDDGSVAGVLSTFSVMGHVVPNYIVSGDLKQISYAPDMGILRSHYDKISSKPLSAVMEKEPLMVGRKESLLSVSAALTAFGKHEYALVVDKQKNLLGIISAGDILDRLRSIQVGEQDDA